MACAEALSWSVAGLPAPQAAVLLHELTGPNIAPETVCSSCHVTCRLPARHVIRSWAAMILSLVYSCSSSENMELHIWSPNAGTLPSHSSTLRALKAPQHQARAYYSAVIITKSNDPDFPFEISPSNAFEGEFSLRCLFRCHLGRLPALPATGHCHTGLPCMWVFSPLRKYCKAKEHF